MVLDNEDLIKRLVAVHGGLRVDRRYAARICLDAAVALREAGVERRRLAQDWCNFCEAIGVDVDTHEAVAAQIKGFFEP